MTFDLPKLTPKEKATNPLLSKNNNSFTTSTRPDGSTNMVISIDNQENGSAQGIKPTPITPLEGFFGNMDAGLYNRTSGIELVGVASSKRN